MCVKTQFPVMNASLAAYLVHLSVSSVLPQATTSTEIPASPVLRTACHVKLAQVSASSVLQASPYASKTEFVPVQPALSTR